MYSEIQQKYVYLRETTFFVEVYNNFHENAFTNAYIIYYIFALCRLDIAVRQRRKTRSVVWALLLCTDRGHGGPENGFLKRLRRGGPN